MQVSVALDALHRRSVCVDVDLLGGVIVGVQRAPLRVPLRSRRAPAATVGEDR